MKYADPSDVILDVGCGSGRAAFILEKKGYMLHAVDIVDYRVVPLKHFKVYDGKSLPFPDNSFDLVSFNFVLHHVPNAIKPVLLKEAKRVSRKHVLVLEDTPKYFFDHVMSFFHCFFWRWKIASTAPFGFFQKERWEQVFRSLGLSVLVSNPLVRFCRKPWEPLARSVFLLRV